jgi:hypothetical protein
MKKIFLSILLISLIFAVSTGQALASYATATASIDLSSGWSTLQGVGGLTLNPTDPRFAFATAVNNTDVPFTTTTANYEISTTTNASALASLIGPNIQTPSYGYLYANANAGPPAYNDPGALAQAGLAAFTFSYSGNTAIKFNLSVPYLTSYDISASPGSLSQATAYASYEVTYYVTNPNRIGPVSRNFFDFATLQVTDGASDIISNAGFITIPFTLKPGDEGSVYFNVTASADASQPVPIPAAVWLLGSGLVGLAGFRRKLLK